MSNTSIEPPKHQKQTRGDQRTQIRPWSCFYVVRYLYQAGWSRVGLERLGVDHHTCCQPYNHPQQEEEAMKRDCRKSIMCSSCSYSEGYSGGRRGEGAQAWAHYYEWRLEWWVVGSYMLVWEGIM